MLFRFTGKYTNGHTSVMIHGARFEGYEPLSVKDEDTALRLMGHPEVEEVAEAAPVMPHEPENYEPVNEQPRRRGRPRKAQ